MEKKQRRLAFIAKDTKTYMNLEEARFKYSRESDKNILFIIVPKHLRSNLNERIQETVEPELWDKIIWIHTWSNCVYEKDIRRKEKSRTYNGYLNIREFFYNYLDRWKLDSIAKRYSPCDLVFSAHKNTQEHLAAKLAPNELILVDSGHRIFKRINRDGFIDYSRWFIAHSRFTRYMYWATGFKVFDRRKTTLFTVYADEIETNHKVVKNNFDYQSHLYQSKEVGNEIVWISTPIYTMAKGVSIEDYVSYIQDYIDQLEIDTGKLVYIPHPGKQTDDEIAYINQRLKCRIDDRDIPVEFKIANYEKLPQMCISPFSSALVNVSLASEGRIKIVSAWHPEFNHFGMWLNWKKDVEKNPNLRLDFVESENCHPLFYIDKDIHKEASYFDFSDWENDRRS